MDEQIGVSGWMFRTKGHKTVVEVVSCSSTFKQQTMSSIAGLPKDDLPHPYLHQCFSMTDQLTNQTWDEYSQIVSDDPYCFWFPIFLPDVE